jgi:hypothetical protein
MVILIHLTTDFSEEALQDRKEYYNQQSFPFEMRDKNLVDFYELTLNLEISLNLLSNSSFFFVEHVIF